MVGADINRMTQQTSDVTITCADISKALTLIGCILSVKIETAISKFVAGLRVSGSGQAL